jgi:hypothetical protein
MARRNDLNRDTDQGIGSMGMLLGGLAVLAVIFGLAFYFNGDRTTTTASNPARPQATTTGSGSSAPVQPTNPAGNVPTTPPAR